MGLSPLQRVCASGCVGVPTTFPSKIHHQHPFPLLKYRQQQQQQQQMFRDNSAFQPNAIGERFVFFFQSVPFPMLQDVHIPMVVCGHWWKGKDPSAAATRYIDISEQ